MSILNLLQARFSGNSLTFMKAIPTEMIVFDERAKYMCKFGCKNYRRKYSCPPESLKIREIVKERNYKWAIVFATTHKIPVEYSRYQTKALNNQKELKIQQICNEIGGLLNSYEIDHLLLAGGSCKACRECSIINDEICRKPQAKQTSMEAIGIDCQRTMHNAKFDFAMPNMGSINRCGCILTNDDELSRLYLKKEESLQKLNPPSRKKASLMCSKLMDEYPELYEYVRLMPISDISTKEKDCIGCTNYGKNFSCPPFSEKMGVGLWESAILWKWKGTPKAKNRYNMALKTAHAAFFSLGYYFSLSLRDCYCDECNPCSYSTSDRAICNCRKILSPSMQSQGVNPKYFGEGRFGIELL